MKKILVAVVAALSLSFSAVHAEDAKPAAKADVGMINPQIIADVDIFALEDAAEDRWKAALPKLRKDLSDYSTTWFRLRLRLLDVSTKWGEERIQASTTPKYRAYDEMSDWCNTEGYRLPEDDDVTAPRKFARLEVRVKVCEDMLPKNSAATAAAPSYPALPKASPFPEPKQQRRKK